MTSELQKFSKQLSTNIELQATRFRRTSLFVKVVLVAIGSAIAGVAQFLEFSDNGATTSQIVGIAACAIVAIGGVFVIVTEQDASSQLALAQKAIETAREAEAKYEVISDLEYQTYLLIELYQAMNVMRGVVEQVANLDKCDEVDLVAKLLKAAERSLVISMDFQQADQWTIGVYMAVPDPTQTTRAQLKCVALKRAIECKIGDTRVWDEGTGIMGVAYANGDEIIIPDLQAEGLSAVFGASGNETRAYDSDRYRSMVAVPIKVEGLAKPWGVVTATSDRVGHFTTRATTGVQPDEGARALAGMVALLVAVIRSKA